MKIKVRFSIGLLGCEIEDVIHVDDDIMTEGKIEDEVQECIFDHIDYSWSYVDEDETE